MKIIDNTIKKTDIEDVKAGTVFRLYGENGIYIKTFPCPFGEHERIINAVNLETGELFSSGPFQKIIVLDATITINGTINNVGDKK